MLDVARLLPFLIYIYSISFFQNSELKKNCLHALPCSYSCYILVIDIWSKHVWFLI